MLVTRNTEKIFTVVSYIVSGGDFRELFRRIDGEGLWVAVSDEGSAFEELAPNSC